MRGHHIQWPFALGGLLSFAWALFRQRQLLLLWVHRVRRRAVRDGAVDLPRLLPHAEMQRLRGLPGRPAQGGRLRQTELGF